MPAEFLSLQPAAKATQGRGNHVPVLESSAIATLEESGARVLESDEGFLLFDVADGDDRRQIALFDTKTESGFDVVGIAIAEEPTGAAPTAESNSPGWNFGPQPVDANVLPWGHNHPLGSIFHYPCSYLYMYANSTNAYVHVCSLDVGNIKFIGSAVAAGIGIFTGLPLLGWLGGIIWWVGVSLFQDSSGSINFYIPGSSAQSHYGGTYYYDGSLAGWYYHMPSGSSWYGYARRETTGVYYYEYLSSY